MMIRFIVAFSMAVLAGIAVARAEDYSRWDRQLAEAVRRGGADWRDLLPLGEGEGQTTRQLILQALQLLSPAGSGKAALNAGRADLLLSALGSIEAAEAHEDKEGVGNALSDVLDATWSVYVQPMLRSAAQHALLPLAAPPQGGVLAARWIEAGKRGDVTIAELFAMKPARALEWRFTTPAEAPPVDRAVLADAIAGGGRLALLMDVSRLGGGGFLPGTAAEADGRLVVVTGDSGAAITACVDRGSQPPAPAKSAKGEAAAPPIDRDALQKRCAAENRPVSGVAGQAILVDARRRLLVFARPVGSEGEADAVVALAASLAQDWP